MATYTPPPYFPQGSLAPADPGRYRKLKLLLAAIALVVLALLAAGIWGIWHLLK